MSRIYLIGAGAIAKHHARAVNRLPDEPKLLVADVNRDALTSFKEQFPHARTFSDVEEMLAEPAEFGDIVIVATPPFTHYELVCKALQTKRHVLSEKPLATSYDESLKMLELARMVERALGCCSNRFLGLPTSEKVKDLIRSKALGKLYHVTFMNRRQRARSGIEYQPTSPWFLSKDKSGGGVLMDWGPYDFTTLNDVLSPLKVEVLHAWSANPVTQTNLPKAVVEVEQHVGATLRYYLTDEHVVEVTYERSACTHGGERAIVEIEGEYGALAWDWLCIGGNKDVTHTFDNNGKVEVSRTIYDDLGEMSFMDKPLVYFYRHLHKDTSIALVNEQVVFNFACLRAIYDCAETGKPQIVTQEEFR